MSILTKNFQVNFTQVPNQIINDKQVSLKAKGLYLFMISKPDYWEFSLNGLVSQLKECKTAILSIMDELIKFGYLEKHKRRDNGRQAVNDYVLYLEPKKVDEMPLTPSGSIFQSQKNRVRKTELEKTTTSNTNSSNTKKSNTLSSSKERDFYKFKERFIELNKNKLFTTQGICWLSDTHFKINDENYIYNTVSGKLVEKDEAFKIWKYLFNNNMMEI